MRGGSRSSVYEETYAAHSSEFLGFTRWAMHATRASCGVNGSTTTARPGHAQAADDGITPMWIACRRATYRCASGCSRWARPRTSPRPTALTPFIACEMATCRCASGCSRKRLRTSPRRTTTASPHVDRLQGATYRCASGCSRWARPRTSPRYGFGPLPCTSPARHLSACKWLFEGAATDITKVNGDPMFMPARVATCRCASGCSKCAAADITKAKNNGTTPMWIACQQGHPSRRLFEVARPRSLKGEQRWPHPHARRLREGPPSVCKGCSRWARPRTSPRRTTTAPLPCSSPARPPVGMPVALRGRCKHHHGG